jgi:hypothetical protein
MLLQPEIWEACMNTTKREGDVILWDCLSRYTSVRPKFDEGLNQMDIKGDISGWFESGRQMLSMHHWRSWFSVDMPSVARISQVIGDEGILMRWVFKGDTVLSNGFSIVEYPKGIKRKELEAVEKTWNKEEDAENYIHKIGPLREPMGREEKVSYGMVETTVLEEVGVRQTYVRRGEWEANSTVVPVDGVIELLWLF